MFKRFSFVAGAMALGLVFAPSLSAQVLTGTVTCTVGAGCGHELRANVPQLVNLTLENATTNIPPVGNAEFDAPQLFAGPQFQTRGNIAHEVSIRATSAQFTTTAASTVKDADDVAYAVVASAAGCGGVAYAPLSTAATEIFDFGRGRSPIQRLCFRITWDYANDGPGDYSLPLDLTIAAQ